MVSHEHLLLPFRQQTMNVVQFIIARNSEVSVRKKWTTPTASPFYLAINHWKRPGNNILYMKAPLGKNELGKLMKTASQSAGLQGNISNHSVRKTLYFSPNGCRSPRQLRRSTQRQQKPEEPRFLQSSIGWPSAKDVSDFKPLRWTEHSVIFCKQPCPGEQHCTSESSKAVNPNETFQSGDFSGACIGKIEGCSFTFNIHREKEGGP